MFVTPWARPGPHLKVYASRSGSMSYKLLMNEESTDPRIFISQLRAGDRLLATAQQMHAAQKNPQRGQLLGSLAGHRAFGGLSVQPRKQSALVLSLRRITK